MNPGDDTNRVVEILKDNEWVKVEFEDLRIGNIFRMLEYGKYVKDERGLTEFEVTSDPALTEEPVFPINERVLFVNIK
jgi:hypothetical protein